MSNNRIELGRKVPLALPLRHEVETPTLRLIGRLKGYSVYDPPGNKDPFIREALKSFDCEMYEDLHGKTRRGGGIPAMYNQLKRFGGPNVRFSRLTPTEKECMRQAIRSASERFSLNETVPPITPVDVGPTLRRDTAAGFSFPGKKKGDVLEEIFFTAKRLIHTAVKDARPSRRFNPSVTKLPPCLASKRGAMSDIDVKKTRLIWMYPSEVLVCEGMFLVPLHEAYLKKPDQPMLIGKSSDRIVQDWFASEPVDARRVGLDISSFDTTIPSYIIEAVFNILENQIAFGYHPRKPGFKAKRAYKQRIIWEMIRWYYTNTPILMPDGRLWRKNHGEPSGTYFTQLADSVANYIYISFFANLQGATIRNLRVLGDDSAFVSRDFSIELCSKDALRTLNVELHPEKCDLAESTSGFKLLGYSYDGGYKTRPSREWFELALYPESHVHSLSQSFSRLIGLYYAGALRDKTFCAFFEYYQTGYPCPSSGHWSKDTKRMLLMVAGFDPGPEWHTGPENFWTAFML